MKIHFIITKALCRAKSILYIINLIRYRLGKKLISPAFHTVVSCGSTKNQRQQLDNRKENILTLYSLTLVRIRLRSCTVFKHALGELHTPEQKLHARWNRSKQTKRINIRQDNPVDYIVLAARPERVYPPCVVLHVHACMTYVIRRGLVDRQCWNTENGVHSLSLKLLETKREEAYVIGK